MSMKDIPAGRNIPHDFNVITEIPAEGGSIKYEVDKDFGLLIVDRFMPTSMHYPCNYGFIPNTLANDGDPTDVLLLTPFPVHPASLTRARPIALLRMHDEAGEDNKILAVPIEKCCVQLAHIQSLKDISPYLLNKITHFFEHYKALEPNKWVKVDMWEDKDVACEEIESSIKRFQEKNK